jgi:hypothetical protein
MMMKRHAKRPTLIRSVSLALAVSSALAGGAIGAGTDAVIQAALAAAATVPDARIELLSVERPRTSCGMAAVTRAEVARPVDGSARIAVKLFGGERDGHACEAWSWVRFRLFGKVPVTLRAVRAGESFGGATALEEREIKMGSDPAALGEGAFAERSLGPGQMIETAAVRPPGPRPGEAVKVVLVTGTISIEQTGRAVPCARNHTCAVLPSGKHVDGAFVEGRLLVQMP